MAREKALDLCHVFYCLNKYFNLNLCLTLKMWEKDKNNNKGDGGLSI
jgi:hypothetical protein